MSLSDVCWARFQGSNAQGVVGLVVRISAFQADGPGSIPGRRSLCLILSFFIYSTQKVSKRFNVIFHTENLSLPIYE